MAFGRLAAAPDTVPVGVFDAAMAPVLTVAPGDTVEIGTVSGVRRVFPPTRRRGASGADRIRAGGGP